MSEVVTLAAVTPEWASALLGTTVTAIRAEPIGTGQVGATYRLHLTGDGPASVIAKVASDDPTSRAAAAAQGSYARETGFYRSFAADLPVPAVHHIGFEGATGDFLLLMADLPSHRPGDQLGTLSLDEVETAVTALATIHRRWQGTTALQRCDWLPGSAHLPAPALDDLYAALWPAFRARYGDRVTPGVARVGDALIGSIDARNRRRSDAPCLIHGDFRPDNMLIGPGGDIVVVDWQTVAIGSGAADLAYFTALSLSLEDRRRHERALVDRWQSLTGAADAWDSYRREASGGFLMGVIAAMLVVRTDRGDAMFLTMCDRSAAMINDFA